MSRRHAAGRHVAVVFGAVLGLLAGCGGPKPYVREGLLAHPPTRVAVLPFVITYAYDLEADQTLPASHEVGRDVLRRTFYRALTPYGYDDVKLAEVDDRLAAAWGPVADGRWQAADPQALGEALGADALVYGELTRLMHFSTPLYTETSLSASLRMVEAASGEVLWRQQVRVAERGGALMKKGQVVDFIKDQARSFKPEAKFLRISDVAVRRLLRGFPDPPLTVENGRPSPGRGAAASEDGAKRLAILPLKTKRRGWQKPAALLRAELTASLQEDPFEVLELRRVEAALGPLGWSEGEPLAELAEALGADLVLRGEVTSWARIYWGLGSWVKAGMRLELVDPARGDILWSAKRNNRRHAGLLKGPTGWKSLVMAPITGLKASQLERVATHLTRSMAEELRSSPAVLARLNEASQGRSSPERADQAP